QPMEAEIDPEDAEDEKSGEQQNDARPAEEPGDGGKHRDQVNGEEAIDVVSLPSHHTRVDRDQPAEHAMQPLSWQCAGCSHDYQFSGFMGTCLCSLGS